jgi:hypothetical protein
VPVSASPVAFSRSRRRTALNVGLAIIGAVLLLFTIRQVGWSDVQAGVSHVGWWFALVVVLGGVRFLVRTRAWMVCAHAVTRARDRASGRPDDATAAPRSTRTFFFAMLAGDALGNLTPLGLLASEPAKVLLVRNRLPTIAAVASVAAENAFYMASVVAMLGGGALVFINLTELPAGLRQGVQAVIGAALAGLVIAAVTARRQPAVLSRLARLASRISGRGHGSEDRLREIETLFYGLMSWPPSQLAQITAWEAAFHVVAVLEVYLVLTLLPGGTEASLAAALVFETTGRLIAVVFKSVPYRLGVDEAGTALVASALALDPTAGVALALIRRMRTLCWNAVGLVVLARQR